MTGHDDGARPPNVLLIVTDDLAWGDLGCHGNPRTRTPQIDGLHDQGTSLTRYCSGPLCTPARAALMTGRHPYRTRAIDTYVGRSMLDPGERVLPELFRDAGFATGIFGKWHLGDSYPMRPIDRGFDESLVHRGGGLAQPANIGRNSYFNPDLIRNGHPVRTVGYCTDIFASAAIEFVEQHRSERFFCYLATNAPHSPLEVGDEWIEPHRSAGLPEPWARVYGMVDNIDDNVGRVLSALDEWNLRDETLVIFTSDHGPCGSAQWEGRNRFNAGLRGRKSQMYEGGIRVPMLWRWPGEVQQGQHVDRIANPIDVLPTLADICGLVLPDDRKIDGVSLRPLLSGATAVDSWPERSICMQWHRGDRPERFRNAATITQRWKAYWPTGPGRPELYDLSVDGTEQHDVSDEFPDVVRRLEQTYDEWFDDVSATRPDNYAAPRIVVDGRAEATTWLTRQDWRLYADVPEGWNRDHPGYWLISVAEAGAYRIGIDLDDQRNGRLWFSCGDERYSCPTHVVTEIGFTVHLDPGPQKLEAFVTEDDGNHQPAPVPGRTGVRLVSVTAAGHSGRIE